MVFQAKMTFHTELNNVFIIFAENSKQQYHVSDKYLWGIEY